MSHPQESVLAVQATAQSRKIKKVPFVELYNGRVQGVVSSGSSVERVYVAFLEAGTGNFYCSTNNNRPCGGLRGSPCKHIQQMVREAVLQFGHDRVARYLRIPDADQARDLVYSLGGSLQKEQAGEVFSRFLNYLRFVQLEGSDEPMPEMTFFISG